MEIAETEIRNALQRWSEKELANQRWFPGRGKFAGTWEILDYLLVPESETVLIVAGLDGPGRFFLPMRLEKTAEGRNFVDAADDPFYHDLLTAAAPGRKHWPGRNGEFIVIRTDKPLGPAGRSDAPLSSSTNSLALPKNGGFLKTIRQLRAGVHPEVFILSSLASAGNPPVPDLLGWLTYRHASGEEYTLAVWEEYLLSDGTARQIFTRWAREGRCGEILTECRRLGETVAELHRASLQCFPVEQWRLPEFQRWRQSIRDSLRNPALEEQELIGAADEWLAQRPRPLLLGKKIRVHGDLHLEQLLLTPDGWMVVDFEGEPLRGTEARNMLASPLKDLAAMIRSFDYLALEEKLEPSRVKEWSGEFLDGYLQAFAGYVRAYLPNPWLETLRLFLLERVIYELEYEVSLRPERRWVPVAGLARLLRGEIL